MNCKWCDTPLNDDVLVHVSECQSAPVADREMALAAIESRKAYAKQDACCLLRKKILLKPIKLPKEYCGIDDSELADVMTFETFQGKDVVQPRFCAWCGKPWVRMGLNVL